MLNGSPARRWTPEQCHELEARAVLAMPTPEARRVHLAAVGRYRGQRARRLLEEAILQLWRAGQVDHSSATR